MTSLCRGCEHFLDMIFDKPKCQAKDETIYKERTKRCEDYASNGLYERAWDEERGEGKEP